MKVRSVPQPPPPREIQMLFPKSEGWALVMAIRDAYKKYPDAVERDDWLTWASMLDDELRR